MTSVTQSVYDAIERHDDGDGAPVDDVVDDVTDDFDADRVEDVIDAMRRRGDVYGVNGWIKKTPTKTVDPRI